MTRIKGLLLGFGAGVLLSIISIPLWLMGIFIFISSEAFLAIFIIIFLPLFTAIIGYVWGGIIQDRKKKIQETPIV